MIINIYLLSSKFLQVDVMTFATLQIEGNTALFFEGKLTATTPIEKG